ncbi:MAG: ClpXP protease specificity-enhancing factor [Proteobacteria bacterium]|nr:ClpXP protease specificity-enhancing factor [Pseudomonadota bacterium]
MGEIATKPYLLRALYEWCVDNGYTPHLAVKVDSRTQVPAEFVRDGEITLNIAPTAVHRLQLGNEVVEFSARFAGVARQISVPIQNVQALYARETGHGMTFEVEPDQPVAQARDEADSGTSNDAVSGVNLPAAPAQTAPVLASTRERPEKNDAPGPDRPKPGGKPTLRRVK